MFNVKHLQTITVNVLFTHFQLSYFKDIMIWSSGLQCCATAAKKKSNLVKYQ